MKDFKRLVWTQSAYNCYKRGCVCGIDCENYIYCRKMIAKIKPMKQAVMELINRYGLDGLKEFESAMKNKRGAYK